MDTQKLKLKALPEGATNVLTRWEKIKYWFLTNRVPIGGIIGGISGIIRLGCVFQTHSAVADIVKGIADLVTGAGTTVLFSGLAHTDEHHTDTVNAIIRQRSGQMPAFQRRANDKMKVTFPRVGPPYSKR